MFAVQEEIDDDILSVASLSEDSFEEGNNSSDDVEESESEREKEKEGDEHDLSNDASDDPISKGKPLHKTKGSNVTQKKKKKHRFEYRERDPLPRPIPGFYHGNVEGSMHPIPAQPNLNVQNPFMFKQTQRSVDSSEDELLQRFVLQKADRYAKWHAQAKISSPVNSLEGVNH
jgi:hypothetical protein